MEHRAGWLDPVFIGLSVVGYAGVLWVALAAAVAVVRGRAVFPVVVLAAACVWSADLIALGIKALTDRPRPFEVLPQADPLVGATVGQSMPSGHAATSFAAAVLLTYFWPRAAPFFFLLATAIAFSRVYVGVHYLSDVFVGAVLGVAVGLAWVVALRRPRRIGAARRRSGATPPRG